MKPVNDPTEQHFFSPIVDIDDPHEPYLSGDDLPSDSFVPDPQSEDSRPGPLDDDPTVFSAERILRKPQTARCF